MFRVEVGWRRLRLMLGLAAACVAVRGVAQTDVGNFRVPNVNDQGVLESLLTGEKARMFTGKPTWIEGLKIELFEPDGKTVRVTLTSPGCMYDTRKNYAESDKPVTITGKGFTIDGVGYRFDSNTTRMELLSEVRVVFRDLDFTPPRPAAKDGKGNSAAPETP